MAALTKGGERIKAILAHPGVDVNAADKVKRDASPALVRG